MAEAFARKYGINASSAGTVPSERVNRTVVQVMNERGVELSSNIPKMLTLEMIEGASLVVTMGCSVEEVCPRPMLARMRKKLVDWHLEDPKGKPIDEVRRVRDKIEGKVGELSRAETNESS